MQILHVHCSEKCGCSRESHEPELETRRSAWQEPDEWKVESHTKTEPTDAFGEVQFADSTVKARKVGTSVKSVLN